MRRAAASRHVGHARVRRGGSRQVARGRVRTARRDADDRGVQRGRRAVPETGGGRQASGVHHSRTGGRRRRRRARPDIAGLGLSAEPEVRGRGGRPRSRPAEPAEETETAEVAERRADAKTHETLTALTNSLRLNNVSVSCRHTSRTPSFLSN